MNKLQICCILAAAGMLAKANAQNQPISVTFDTPGDLGNNFNIFQNASPGLGSPYSESSGGGVNGSGSVAVSQIAASATLDATATYKNSNFDFSTSGAAVTVSAMFNLITTQESSQRLLQLGFVNDPTSGMNGNAGFSFMSMRFNPPATIGSSVFSPQWQTKVSAGTATVSTGGTIGGVGNVTLTTGDWYKMSLDFVNQGSGSIQAKGFIQDYGSNGTSPGTIFTLDPITLTSVDIAADSSVYAAFRGFGRDGLGNLDNFTAVPEPATWTLAALAGGALTLIRRRKQ